MTIGLTNRGIEATAGQAALLPNQPIFHNCHIKSDAAGVVLKCGDIVKLDTAADKKGLVVVSKAAATDQPLGVVVFNPIKTGFEATDLVSVFPENACVFMPAGAANITRGAKLQFNANGQVLATATSGNGYIGIALTEPTAIGDLIVVQIKTGKA